MAAGILQGLKRSAMRLRWLIAALLLLLVWARWGPMDPLFTAPRSTVLLDRDEDLLGATVAADGQWRMPPGDSIPHRFATCLIEFEDRRFRSHWGIRIPSLFRAWQQNRRAGRVVSGGSTITMQAARMARGNRPRTVWNKLIEIALALRIELRQDKESILRLYAANAPFGGNVVGLDAAAWRWYGRDPHALGWGECATLAVLPNAPARIHPGRNRDALHAKRDRLLDRLLEVRAIDSLQWSLAKEEPLPEAPHALPRLAPHLLSTLQGQGRNGQRIRSTISRAMQQRANDLALRYGALLRANEVHNAAMLVVDVPTGEVLVYLGNLPDADADHSRMVDIVQAPRSTGSLLKPFLYAAMLQAGERMPDQLVADLPTSYEGFAPRNFDERYAGAVPASQALSRSLNVPAVRALREHGVERTRRMLVGMGLKHLNRSASNYGLSLIVGGGEGTLWELTGGYASIARVLLRYGGTMESIAGAVHAPRVFRDHVIEDSSLAAPVLNAGALHHTIQALQQVNRPEAEAGWHRFAGTERIAWKTGTSFGHRDAWAIGVTDRFAVGVWTGNASGEGRPGLTGTLAAAPLLFDLFAALPDGHGFDPPYDALEHMSVCRASGFRAGPDCGSTEERQVLSEAMRTAPCPYCRRILVDAASRYRVPPTGEALSVSWFSLPPAMEHYYAPEHPGYRPLPPWAPGSGGGATHELPIQMVYPEQGAVLYVPVVLDGELGRLVLRAAHRSPAALVHWDLDGNYLGSTVRDHQMAVTAADGEHRLTLTDESGTRLDVDFRTVSSSNR
ncbi:MAG: penicillin-binding protein 1C [Flavobacteriales bacterium]|nr:penicillin-binding protein 1C [Flavobacteriales bacterium]